MRNDFVSLFFMIVMVVTIQVVYWLALFGAAAYGVQVLVGGVKRLVVWSRELGASKPKDSTEDQKP